MAEPGSVRAGQRVRVEIPAVEVVHVDGRIITVRCRSRAHARRGSPEFKIDIGDCEHFHDAPVQPVED